MKKQVIKTTNKSKTQILSEDVKSHTVEIVNEILESAIERQVSDIHIEPYKGMVKVRFRNYGNLYTHVVLENISIETIILRIKVISNLNISEKKNPQDGRLIYEYKHNKYEMRVSIIPSINGEKIALRILYSDVNLKKDKLGFDKNQLDSIDNMMKNGSGLILVTGPTGSGKSTTLYALIDSVDTSKLNVITIEDPVERKIDGITQVEINEKAGMVFSNALKSILRQDPDIIMIGEIRDSETAKIALQAAVTGHLVFSTLHTRNTISTVNRLLNMDVDKELIVEGLAGIISQRLTQVKCPTYDFVNQKCLVSSCDKKYCYKKGFVGQKIEAELLEFTQEVKSMFIGNKSEFEIRKYCESNGMKMLAENSSKFITLN